MGPFLLGAHPQSASAPPARFSFPWYSHGRRRVEEESVTFGRESQMWRDRIKSGQGVDSEEEE